MASIQESAAAAIEAALNTGSQAGSFVQRFIAEWSFGDFDVELEDLDALRVDVIPAGFRDDTALEDRSSLAYYVQTDIGIRKRFSTEQVDSGRIPRATIAPLAQLVEEIAEYTMPAELSGYTSAQFESIEILQPYIRAHLRQFRQFTGVVRVVHYVEKSVV